MRPKKYRQKYGYYRRQKQLKRRYKEYCKSYKKLTGNDSGLMTELMWAFCADFADAVQDPLIKRGIEKYNGLIHQ